MRLANILRVAIVATIFASLKCASTAKDFDEVKVSQMIPPNMVTGNTGDGKRLLRSVERDNKSDEERTNWAAFKAKIPWTASYESNKETEKIKKLASTFAEYHNEDKMPYDAFLIKGGLNNYAKAMKYGQRYEKYLENPTLYH
ncbi:unnamed protein product [Phytophthora lilii]|uniref:RxLR effector protein n=1 Tax=Phytophthora lilii TaxID=2077276 RepID=A0A9W6UEK5_9STRA|nr:unnamed protein product [Phytophthora lilii]